MLLRHRGNLSLEALPGRRHLSRGFETLAGGFAVWAEFEEGGYEDDVVFGAGEAINVGEEVVPFVVASCGAEAVLS